MPPNSEATRQLEELRSHFLYRYGGYFVELILVVSVVGNLIAAVTLFSSGLPLFGLCAIPATFLIPRAVFALCLIRERHGMMYANQPRLLTHLYRKTFLRYHPENFMLSGDGAAAAYLRESFQFILWLVPLIALVV
jgi:hypothetical protein